MTKIKICGITTPQDAHFSCSAGADALGFNFSRKSPRYIQPENARDIIRTLPPFVTTAGIFVEQEPEEINEICRRCGLDVAQLHSEQYTPRKTLAVSGARVIRVFRTDPDFSIPRVREYARATGITAFLFDAYRKGQPGGTGERIDQDTAQSIFRQTDDLGHGILAGGLNPDNVVDAVRTIRPYAVDTASGVESSPGKKDHQKITAFIAAVQNADRSYR